MANYIDRTTKYAKEVLAGNLVIGKWAKLACQRHLDDLKKSKTKSFDYKFDLEKADRAIDFFKFLNHSKGKWAGTPIELQLWQCFRVGSVFGWVHKSTELRRFKTAYNQVARKNGKSTETSGIGLNGLIADGEQGAEIYSAAVKKDQSKIIFDEAIKMVKASPLIKKYVNVFKNNMNMPTTNSKFEPLSSDTKSLDGLNVHFGLIDELHAHPTREVYDLIETATGARTQPLIWIITTAGFNVNGICYELYDYACKVLEGVIEDDTFFAYIAQLDEDDDWRDPKVWVKANPNLDVSVNMEDLERKCEKAKEIPAAQNNFLCKHLNMWVSQEVRWMPMEKWKECPEYDFSILEGLDCYVGNDLSATTDLTSVNLEFPLDDGYYAVISHSFMPEDKVMEAEKRDNVPYSTWIRQGYITATPGSVVDYDWIESYIETMSTKYNIIELDFDPWNATQFANNMQKKGHQTVEIRQGIKTLSEPTKDILKIVLNKKLYHNNNPVLTWAMSNAVAKKDQNDNIMLDKSKAKFRIDPAAAFVTSHVRAMHYQNNKPVDLNAHITDGYLDELGW